MNNEPQRQIGTARMPTVLVYRRTLLPLSETFIREQLTALRRWRGILVGQRRIDALPLDGIDVQTLRADCPNFPERLRWKVSKWMGTVPRPTLTLLQQEAPSLLHVHFGVNAVEAWPIAKALNLPMLVTLHGFDINIDRDWWEAGYGGRRMRSYPARLLKLAKQPRIRFLAVSDSIRHRATAYGIPENKICVRRIGIDCTKFMPRGRPIAEREGRVLFVGRLEEKKGCEYLIRAFTKVQQAVPEAVLIVVGEGRLRDNLQKLSLKLGVHAHFRGSLSNLEVQQELCSARVFCLPSIRATNGDAEGLPIALLEAQASGVPVVTSSHGGQMEAICDGVSGFAVAQRDVHGLATRITTLLTDNAVATTMASAGPAFIAQTFDIRRCTEELNPYTTLPFRRMRNSSVFPKAYAIEVPSPRGMNDSPQLLPISCIFSFDSAGSHNDRKVRVGYLKLRALNFFDCNTIEKGGCSKDITVNFDRYGILPKLVLHE